MLNSYVRNNAYFEILRDINRVIAGVSIDNEFKNLSSYIDDYIMSNVEDLKLGKITGVTGKNGCLLRNIGDGSTTFTRITNDDIPNKTISLDRIWLYPNIAVPYYFNNTVRYLDYLSNSATLINDGSSPFMAKITNANIGNRTITSRKIRGGTLTAAHLKIPLGPLVLGILDPTSIIDRSITPAKVSFGTFTDRRMSDQLIALRETTTNFNILKNTVTGLAQDEHLVKERHILNNSIDFTHVATKGSSYALWQSVIPKRSFKLTNTNKITFYRIPSVATGTVRFSALTKIAPEHILDNSFKPSSTGTITKTKLGEELRVLLKKGGLNI